MPTPYEVFKETAVPAPGSVVPNGIYFVAPAGRPNYVEIYVADAAGTLTRRTINQVDIQAMIDAALVGGAASGNMIVDTIADRNAIVDPPNGQQVLVIDASADPNVTSGAATYIWRESTSTWIKISEAESMDVSLAWANITGRPSSSAAAIDTAVSNSHTHANKTELDKISQDVDGNLLYDGELPATGWNSTNW